MNIFVLSLYLSQMGGSVACNLYQEGDPTGQFNCNNNMNNGIPPQSILPTSNVSYYSTSTLEEKSGAETAPGWRRFHVHRMAPI